MRNGARRSKVPAILHAAGRDANRGRGIPPASIETETQLELEGRGPEEPAVRLSTSRFPLPAAASHDRWEERLHGKPRPQPGQRPGNHSCRSEGPSDYAGGSYRNTCRRRMRRVDRSALTVSLTAGRGLCSRNGGSSCCLKQDSRRTRHGTANRVFLDGPRWGDLGYRV